MLMEFYRKALIPDWYYCHLRGSQLHGHELGATHDSLLYSQYIPWWWCSGLGGVSATYHN